MVIFFQNRVAQFLRFESRRVRDATEKKVSSTRSRFARKKYRATRSRLKIARDRERSRNIDRETNGLSILNVSWNVL